MFPCEATSSARMKEVKYGEAEVPPPTNNAGSFFVLEVPQLVT